MARSATFRVASVVGLGFAGWLFVSYFRNSSGPESKAAVVVASRMRGTDPPPSPPSMPVTDSLRRLYANYTEGSISREEWRAYWLKEADSDFASALRMYLDIMKNPRRAERDIGTFDEIVKAGARRDPIKTALLVKNLCEDSHLRRGLTTIGTIIDPSSQSVREYLTIVKDVVPLDSIGDALFRRLGNSADSTQLLRLANEFNTDPLLAPLADHALYAYFSQTDGAVGSRHADFWQSLEGGLIRTPSTAEGIAAYLADHEPQGTFLDGLRESLDSRIDSTICRSIIETTMAHWTADDPDGAAGWLINNRNHPMYDTAAAGFVQVAKQWDPIAADAWLKTISNPEFRSLAASKSRIIGTATSRRSITVPK